MTDLEVGGAEGGLAVGHVLAACHSRCQQAHARQLVSLSRTSLRMARQQGRQRATERHVREGWRELVRGSDDDQGRGDRNSRRVQEGTLGVF